MSGEGDFGLAVDAPRHFAVVDRDGVLTEDVLDHQDPFGEPDVRQLRRGDEVADGIHALFARAAPLVDLDEALVAHDHAALRPVEPERLGIRTATDGEHDEIDLDRLAVAELHRGAAALLVRRVPRDGDAGAHVDASLLERLEHDLRDVFVQAGQDLRQRLEDRDLRAEVAHHRCELTPDGAAPDHDRGTGKLVDREQLVAGDDQRAVDVEARDRAGHGTRGEDDRVGR